MTFYERDQKKALELLGRKIPTYHLLDVRNHLIKKYGEVKVSSKEKNPIHNRISLEKVKNKNNWNKGFDKGYPLWLEGDRERKENNIKKALELFDEARYYGYKAPALYISYAMGYRKLKDYDNEIGVIDEAVERFGSKHNTTILKLKMRRERVVELKKKQNKQNN